MEILYDCCAGIVVHKTSVTVCLLTPRSAEQPRAEVRTFGTLTPELQRLSAWLKDAGCQHVAMESTGIYWRPLYNLLDGQFTLYVVNAQHIKAVPGRKTDVKDAEWIAHLLRHGLLRGSFVPSAEQRA